MTKSQSTNSQHTYKELRHLPSSSEVKKNKSKFKKAEINKLELLKIQFTVKKARPSQRHSL